ncbi:MAG: hypothetical protein LVR00_09700 [Rhabdochlamydiaceae bacterium]
MKPEDISGAQPIKRLGDDQPLKEAPNQSFQTYMDKAAQQNTPTQKPPTISPFDLAHGATPLTQGANIDTLLTQAKSAHVTLGDISTQLNTKNLKLKQSQRYLLRNKLGDANSMLKAANLKAGGELPAAPATPSSGGIIGKFLDFVNEGQSHISAIQKKLVGMKEKGDSLNPADFLAIQLKLGHAQQEIEYASIMLSKAVEDMKMLFNVQL